MGLGAFDELTPFEAGSGPDEGDEVRCVHGPPSLASPIPSQVAGDATRAAPDAEGLNPVRGVQKSAEVPDLPWTDPAWFNEQLRAHMSDEHREELVLLLKADS